MLKRLSLWAAMAAAGLAGLLAPASAQAPNAFPSKPDHADRAVPGRRDRRSPVPRHCREPHRSTWASRSSSTTSPAAAPRSGRPPWPPPPSPTATPSAQIAIPVFRVPYMQKATFDPVKDFTYIILLGGYTLGAVVKADGPFKTWKDVIDFAKANPGKFTYATIGPATTNAIAMELMARQSGVQFTHIPTKGGGESIAARSSAATSWRWWNRRPGRRWSRRASSAC